MAIFYLSDIESMAAKQTRRFARSFMSRHKVPCLVITQSQLWNRPTEALTLDYSTPHLCLETSGADNARPRVIKRLPIDLATFLNLDAVQVNRNLACVTDIRASVEKKFQDLPMSKGGNARHVRTTEKSGYCSAGASGYNYSAWTEYILENVRSFVKFPVPGLVLLALTISCLGLRQYMAYSQSDAVVANTQSFHTVQGSSLEHLKPTVKTSTARVEPTPTYSLASPAPLRTAPSIAKAAAKAGTRSNTDLASPLLDSQALTLNNSVGIEVHVVDDPHVALRPPHWFMRHRKAPKLLFNVTRKNQPVIHELATLSNGVYILKVPREEAYGVVDISVHTTSKQENNETFQVDFGDSWLRAAAWKNAARTVTDSIRGDVVSVQTSLSLIFTSANTEVHKVKQDVIKKADTIRQGLDWVRSASLNRTAMSTDIVLAQTKSLSRHISRRFSNKGAILTKQLTIHGQNVRGDIRQYLGNRAAVFKNTWKVCVRAARVDLRAVRNGMKHLRHDQLRSTQKGALKAWWKMAGVPKQAHVHLAAAGSQHKRGARAKKAGKE